MCGIFGIVRNNNVIPDVIKGIKNLEYRGYDSAGIGFIDNNKIQTIKSVGEIKYLEEKINSREMYSFNAIAHTRWATHGRPAEENAHPFVSKNKEFCLVHNGIIENYIELKNTLSGDFSSSTDSEVVLKLIEKYYNGNMLSTLSYISSLLKGSYAFAILSIYDPNTIFVLKNISPCVVSMNNDEARVCSDIGSIGEVDEAYILEDNTIAVLTSNKIEFFDTNIKPISIAPTKVNSNKEYSKENFAHFMRKEIYDNPKTILNTCYNYQTIEDLEKIISSDILNGIKYISIIGCGTAYHAGLVGKKLLEEKLLIPISCEIASEFIYSHTNIDSNTLTIFVSQSGETADTLKALSIAKNKGSKTLAITNVENSSITFLADIILYTKAEKEVAVASTKAYIGQLTIFYILSEYFSFLTNRVDTLSNSISSLNYLATTLDIPNLEFRAKEIAEIIYNENDIYMIGRCLDYISALESSLKLKEISYIHSEAYPSGELKHGTISLIENCYIFSFLTDENLLPKSISNTIETISRGAKVITISQYPIDINGVYKYIKLNKYPDKFMPIISVVFMQLVAYHTSVLKGNNPDKPRALAKSVTVE